MIYVLIHQGICRPYMIYLIQIYGKRMYVNMYKYMPVYIYIHMLSAPTRTYLLWIHLTWTTFNHPVWTTSLCIPLHFCSELYPSTIHIVWTASLYHLVWTADFYWKEKGFLKGRLLSKQKSWIGQGRVLFENSLIDKEESHLVREEKRS